MKRRLEVLSFVIGIGITASASAQVGTPIFQENFNGLVLGPSVNVRLADVPTTHVLARSDAPGTVSIPDAFTHTPPTGWTVHQNWDNFGHVDLNNPNYNYNNIVGNIGIGNQGNPSAGVDEWEGWSFADSDFWLTADTQGRENFRDGLANHSIVAVADNDEYDDFGGGRGGQYYNTGMSTNNIPVAGKTSVDFTFDSSWDQEDHDDAHTVNPALAGGNVNNQTTVIYASFDGGTPQLVKQWNSDDNDVNFKPTAYNETVSFPITVPAGAQNMKLTLGQLNSGNDWWWAVDNLAVSSGGGAPFWTENFESVALGPSVNERLSNTVFAPQTTAGTSPIPATFTHTTPAGWSVNNDALSLGSANDDVGLFEFEGWTFTTAGFDALASGNAQLSGFAKSTGNFALADSDAYTTDELGEGFGGPTILQTPAISLAGQAANSLKLQFDSAWRTSGSQTAEITVQYGAGPETTVLNWTSASADPNFHATNLNETVTVDLNNPASGTAIIRFKYTGTDNWFWAIDNLKVGAVANADFDADGDVDGNDFLRWQRGLGTGTTRAQGNADGDADVDGADLAVWKTQFGQTGLPPVSGVPEPAGLCLSAMALAALGAFRGKNAQRAS